MEVKDVMNTDVKTVGEDTSVQQAATQMSKNRIGCLVVVKDSKLIGIITERDILQKVVAGNMDSSKTKVKEVMTKNVHIIKPTMSLSEAADLMIEKDIKKLPVVHGNQLVGIVTATDLCSAEPKMMEELSKLLMIPGKRQVIAG